MKHVTAGMKTLFQIFKVRKLFSKYLKINRYCINLHTGTVNSVTKLASSVARNLDRLTLDEEHLQRQEESRRMRPQGMAQGLYQGLTGFGMSLLGRSFFLLYNNISVSLVHRMSNF